MSVADKIFSDLATDNRQKLTDNVDCWQHLLHFIHQQNFLHCIIQVVETPSQPAHIEFFSNV
jgi:hypothetical protein